MVLLLWIQFMNRSAKKNSVHSYLTDQEFLVNIENKYSSILKISCGVPQRSILCPLLFLIYVNDMKQPVSSGLLNPFCLGQNTN